MKIRNCVNCGKTPKRDYQEEKKLRAIEPGEWDSQSWRNHLAENQMEFRHPRGNEFDRTSIKKAIFTVASQSIIYSKVINEKSRQCYNEYQTRNHNLHIQYFPACTLMET